MDFSNSGRGNARGYLFVSGSNELYFPDSNKYPRDRCQPYEVLIWSRPRVLVVGAYYSATLDEDVAQQTMLAFAPAEIDASLFDHGNHKPRANRRMPVIDSVRARCRPRH